MWEPSKGKTKISGRYKVEQPIKNFRIRVKIVQQKSPIAELFENESETLDGNFLEDEEFEFGWQEKVLGPFEVKYYRDERNCVTDKHNEYRQRILEMDEEEERPRLYSYIQGDAYYPDPDVLTVKFKSCLSLRNQRATPQIKNQKPFANRYNKEVVNQMPTRDRINENHYLYKDEEVMYIMVDLSSKDDVDSSQSETLLCTIKYELMNGYLTVYPDFSEENYTVEGVGMNYDFWITHASPKPTSRDIKHKLEIDKQEGKRMHHLKEAKLYHQLEVPGIRTLRVYLTLDIKTAREFYYDDALFVTYRLDLPQGWESPGCLMGRTQRCRSRYRQANFSYCAEMVLDLDLADREEAAVSWPWLVFSVASLDSWTRYRIEGYGSLALPRTPGSYSFELKTWRPVSGFVGRLRRFFTGGEPVLDDLGYCAIPLEHDGSCLDKRVLKVVPSGYVDVKLNVILQSLDRLESRSTDMLDGVDDVIARFKEARQRMLEARAMCV